MVRISGGSLFQSLGAAKEKAPSPQHLHLDLSTSSTKVEEVEKQGFYLFFYLFTIQYFICSSLLKI